MRDTERSARRIPTISSSLLCCVIHSTLIIIITLYGVATFF